MYIAVSAHFVKFILYRCTCKQMNHFFNAPNIPKNHACVPTMLYSHWQLSDNV
jgi:hypothetical protein